MLNAQNIAMTRAPEAQECDFTPGGAKCDEKKSSGILWCLSPDLLSSLSCELWMTRSPLSGRTIHKLKVEIVYGAELT